MDCPVCLDLFVEPQVGTCGHTVCKPGSKALHANQCPQCRKRVRFSTNFALMALVREQKSEEYQAREKAIQLESCPQAYVADMCETWPDTKVLNSNYDKATILQFLKHIRTSIEEKKNFNQIMTSPKGGIVCNFSSKEYCYSLSNATQHYYCAVECDEKVYIMTSRNKAPFAPSNLVALP